MTEKASAASLDDLRAWVEQLSGATTDADVVRALERYAAYCEGIGAPRWLTWAVRRAARSRRQFIVDARRSFVVQVSAQTSKGVGKLQQIATLLRAVDHPERRAGTPRSLIEAWDLLLNLTRDVPVSAHAVEAWRSVLKGDPPREPQQ